MKYLCNKIRLNHGFAICLFFILATFSCKEDEDVNKPNQAPVIENQSFSIDENSANDTVIGSVVASDQDEDELSYRITDGNTDDVVAINASSGQLRVNNSSALDFETNPTITLVVEVSDGEDASTANVVINVSDQTENTAPTIQNQEFAVDENSAGSTEVGTVQASDAEQSELTYTITNGNTGDVFNIDTNTGLITVAANATIDFEVVSTFELTISVNDGMESSTAVITININDISIEPITTSAQLNTMLEESYTSFEEYVEFQYILDGVYANVTTAPNTDWDDLHAHTQNSLDPMVAKLWNDAYEIIFDLNNIIENAEGILTTNQELEEVLGQTKAMRAYLYFQLIKWFENIPLENSFQAEATAISNSSSMIDFINSELSSAVTILPASWTGEDEGNINKGFAEALQNRIYLFNNDLSNALSGANNLQGNVLYELDDNTNDFVAANTEIINGFDQTGDNTFTGFFQKGNFVPVFRLTEAVLIDAEVNTNQGNLVDAIAAMDELRLRAGELAITPGISQPNLLDLVFDQWNTEMSKEGISFQILKRFGRATTDLIIEDFKLLLPIPQEVIDNNPGFFQNPGY